MSKIKEISFDLKIRNTISLICNMTRGQRLEFMYKLNKKYEELEKRDG